MRKIWILIAAMLLAGALAACDSDDKTASGGTAPSQNAGTDKNAPLAQTEAPTARDLGAREKTAGSAPAGFELYVEGGVFTSKDGETLYDQSCLGCHMAGGKGSYTGAGFYPALADNPMLSTPDGPAYVVVNGLRGMPWFGDMFSDEQVAAVVNYVITHFGNQSGSTLEPAEVRNFRPAQ